VSKLPPNLKLREYSNETELSTRADAVLKEIAKRVEDEFGNEENGVMFMPALNIVCKLKSDPTSDVDPMSFTIIKRPTSAHQVDTFIHNILLKDELFIGSIMRGLAEQFTQMLSVHADMTALVSSMEESLSEESEVKTSETETETEDNKGKVVPIMSKRAKKGPDSEVN
jgi:hypothetical protein